MPPSPSRPSSAKRCVPRNSPFVRVTCATERRRYPKPKASVRCRDSGLMGTLIRPTALERHAGFFDANGDGFVTIAETRSRLSDLGLPAPLVLFFSLLVNVF